MALRARARVQVRLGFGFGLGISAAFTSGDDAFSALSAAACASAAYVSTTVTCGTTTLSEGSRRHGGVVGVVARGFTAARLLLLALPE